MFSSRLLLATHPSKTSKGFTLIELMVVLTIVGIVSVITIPASVNLNRRIRLSAAQSEIIRAARTAQLNARRFRERWNVMLYQTTNLAFVAAYPENLGVTPLDAGFVGACQNGKRTCVNTPLDPGVAVDQSRSNFANTCTVGTFCRRIVFEADGGNNINAALAVRHRTEPDNSTYALCVRTSSRLGAIRLDC